MILIAGDSFCADIGLNSWVDIVKKELKMPILHYANSGSSWWATRRAILKNYDKNLFDEIKIAIFCHTEGSRIPNADDIPIGSWVVDNTDWLSPALQQACKLYYEYLYDPEYSIWTQQQWINECCSLFNDDTLIIHLHSFPFTIQKIKINKGINVSPALFGISQAEFKTDADAFKFIKNGDRRKNHLSDAHNIVLGNELIRLINLNKKNGQELLDVSKFNIHHNVLNQYLELEKEDIVYKGR